MEVGYVSAGTLNLSGGSLTTAKLVLGRSASGTITQTNGTFTNTGATYMAWSGGSASYNMQGGILNLTTINIGSVANTAFNFSGGDVYLAGNQLTIDQNSWFHVIGDPSLFKEEYLPAIDETHLFFPYVVTTPTWKNDADGAWSVATNWTNSVPNDPTAEAVLGSAISMPRTVTLDAPIAVNKLTFDNTNMYTVSGSGINSLSVYGSINVVSGSHEIAAPVTLVGTVTTNIPTGQTLSISGSLSGGNLINTGGGALSLSGGGSVDAITGAGNLQVAAGSFTANSLNQSSVQNDSTVIVNNSGTVGAVTGTGTLQVASSGTFTADTLMQNTLQNAGTTIINNGGSVATVNGAGSLKVIAGVFTAQSITQGSLKIGTSLQESLAALWHFDEGSGTTAFDSSGHGADLTVNNIAWITPGKVGAASVEFQMQGDYLYRSSVPGTLTTAAGYSVSAWLRPISQVVLPNTGTNDHIINAFGTFQWKLGATVNGSKPLFALNQWLQGGGFATATAPLPGWGTWTLVTTVFDPSDTAQEMKIYADGVLVGGADIPDGSLAQAPGDNPFVVGTHQDALSMYYNGGMDELMVFNRALSAAEVQSLLTSPPANAVPEPSTLVLTLLALATLAGLGWKMR